MPRLLIRGGRRLGGTVRASGRKNAAVAVIPAALLADGESNLENIPDIGDVHTFVRMLGEMGVRVRGPRAGSLAISPNGVGPTAPYELGKRMRASYYLLGVLLARCGRAEVPLPGGCDIGPRPIDQHLKGLRALGAEIAIEHGVIRARARRLVGTRIYLDTVSVGATIHLILAAALAEGVTVIENAARESHVVDVANFVNAMGGDVSGAGTDVVRVRGVPRLRGANYAIIPDEIEAATYLLAGAGTGGTVTVENAIPKHLEPIVAKLREAGVEVRENGETVTAVGNGRPRAVTVKTRPYPGFPTDAQQPMSAFLSLAEGTSIITENVWEGRFRHLEELERMGTQARVEGRTAVIEGVRRLTGAPVRATDLRAGAALLLAGLMAEGETVLTGLEHIERGYEDPIGKLRSLGADVRLVEGD